MLKDAFRRRLNYLRVSLTDKCNLRCIYCIPSEGVELLSHDEVLRNEEFIHLIRIFIDMGVIKIRLTGGEPLVRKGFIDIVARIRELYPDIELCLTTNGVLLDEVIDELYQLQLKKLNISLDTLSRDCYKQITGRDHFNKVLSNIERALGYDYFKIKINAVLFEESLEELDDFIDYFKDRDLVLRFIERMPFLNDDRFQTFVSSDKLIDILKRKGRLERNKRIDTNVAIMFDLQYQGKHSIKIGIIPPVTDSFCSRCNRLRLTCDGNLKTCLCSPVEYDLKTPYRMDMGDEAIRDIIVKAIKEKPEKHVFDRHYKSNQSCSAISDLSKRTMSKIGG